MAGNFHKSLSGTMEAEPAVKAKGANKQLALQNARAAGNWLRMKGVLDKQKKEISHRIDDDKNKLLKQRERLQYTSLSLTSVSEKKEDGKSEAEAKGELAARRMTFSDVYDALMMTVKEQQNSKSVKSEPGMRRGSTLSYDQKKVLRKPMNFSLQSLQRANSSLQSRHDDSKTSDEDTKDDAAEETKRGVFDLSEEEKSLGPTLKLAPTALPPIRSQSVFKPQNRNYHRPVSISTPSPVDIDELKYCRYLRNTARGGRRNSAPSIRHGRHGGHGGHGGLDAGRKTSGSIG